MSALSFQGILRGLEDFWVEQGCAILQPYDMEMGAATFHTATTFKALGMAPWYAAFVQPCRRPKDGRYGQNPNRFQNFHQYQVVLKPSPDHTQELLLRSFAAIGLHGQDYDIRFVEDDWESPTLGAAGLGWEVWANGTEVCQFTYFQQVGNMPCPSVCAEFSYGVERIAMVLHACNSVMDIAWNDPKGDAPALTYADVCLEKEKQFSAFNFDAADVDALKLEMQSQYEQAEDLLVNTLPLPAYELCIRLNHTFNVLDARGAIGVQQRALYMGRLRVLARRCFEVFVEAGCV